MASAESILTKIPVIGGIASIFGAQSDEEKNLLDQYKKMQQMYEAQRPVTQQAHMNALGSVLSPGMFGPINNQLAQMYGPGAQFDVSSLLRDPLAAAQGQVASQARDQHSQQVLADARRQKQTGDAMWQQRLAAMPHGFSPPMNLLSGRR
jgi:hypothetical protein